MPPPRKPPTGGPRVLKNRAQKTLSKALGRSGEPDTERAGHTPRWLKGGPEGHLADPGSGECGQGTGGGRNGPSEQWLQPATFKPSDFQGTRVFVL